MPEDTNPAPGTEKELHAARQLISQYAMAFDLLTRIAHAATEKEVIDNILQVFDLLFSPQTLFYAALNHDRQVGRVYFLSPLKDAVPAIQGRLSGFSRRYAWTDSGNGFQIMIRYNKTDLGVLEIDDVQFPDEKERYLSFSLSITEVCGLAIENAKRYQFIRDAEDQLRTEKEKLEKALSEVKTLSGLIPICSHCKKIRDDKGYWNQVEAYISQHSDAKFSHGICQDCLQLHYADYMPKTKE